MTKKLSIPLLIAFLCAMLISGVVLAAEDTPQVRGQRIYGEIVAIADDSFTMQNQNGEQFTYLVDENTSFRSSEIEEPGITDLQVGAKVAVFAPGRVDENPAARLVILLPDEFDPSQWAGVRSRGKITQVDLDASSFVVQTNSGEEQIFLIDETTRFFGQLSGLSDLQTGFEVAVGGVETDDGELLARLVIATEVQNTNVHAGTITEVTPAAGTFTLQTRQGEELIIAVDENTNYNSRAGKIDGLDDLAPDMAAMVYGSPQDDGIFLAARVIAGNEEDLPNYDVKAFGQITSIGANSLTLQPRNAEEMTFLVDGETTFRARGGEVNGLGDLAEGMFALVGAYETQDGQLLAKLIFVRASQTP
ncbi:MAG: hypothetical protein ISS57_11000 [Anaerolineales bacterium]|nr:hypothetical protein [Anaerolineales bacterium]